MSRALAGAVAAPSTLRASPSRKQRAINSAAGCPAPKRRRIARRDPIVAAAGQGFVNWAVESPLQLDVTEVAAQPGPVLVTLRVPACSLTFGEHLRLVGSCAELGNWDPAAAPALEWAAGDNWSVTVALPPGQHAFKLVIVRQDGSPWWELGADRSLDLPAVVAGSASSSGSSFAADTPAPLLSVTCSWGNTAETHVQPDPAQLAVVAEAAAHLDADLAVEMLQQPGEEAGSVGRLVLNLAQGYSSASLAIVNQNIEAPMAFSTQQLTAQQAQHAQQQHSVAEAAAEFSLAATAVQEPHAAKLDAAAAWADKGPEVTTAAVADAFAESSTTTAPLPAAAEAPPAAAAAPAELPVKPATTAFDTALPSAATGCSGETLFHFGGSSDGPSALQLARQQLVGRLPQEAAAGLEAALRSMDGAPGCRQQRAALARLALQGPAVPADQLYGVGSLERRPLAVRQDSPSQATAVEQETDELADLAADLAAEVGHRLTLTGSQAPSGSSGSAIGDSHPAAATCQEAATAPPNDPVLRGSFPGAAAYLAAESLLTFGGLVWSAGRAALPNARRRVADAAVVLACTAAVAVALS